MQRRAAWVKREKIGSPEYYPTIVCGNYCRTITQNYPAINLEWEGQERVFSWASQSKQGKIKNKEIGWVKEGKRGS